MRTKSMDNNIESEARAVTRCPRCTSVAYKRFFNNISIGALVSETDSPMFL